MVAAAAAAIHLCLSLIQSPFICTYMTRQTSLHILLALLFERTHADYSPLYPCFANESFDSHQKFYYKAPPHTVWALMFIRIDFCIHVTFEVEVWAASAA
jgi:hypothetical protein